MSTTSLTRIATFAGGFALALAAGTGLASAEPQPAQPSQPVQPGQPGLWSQNPAISTTCNYSQVVAAMNAQSPKVAAEFNAAPMAQSFLQNFLAAPPQQREEMLQQAQGVPEAAEFVNLIGPISKTCDKY
ncbi:hemophore-related protein [[Mycobacterium] crassicus]|uniref:Hemophore-related protein n=1 Tax=[Mycobacterium] crassicus TaxID=2872309 RepID=A0ABU5XC86_9MYCO|nr:hemophore-related protein [Mycolicibacter sp. MYC098]MEB3019911.1 hemophore-related protein [Mycolicibacter sp. MYC098]